LTNPSAVYYRAPVPAIVVRDGPRAGERIELGEGETLLGRATSDFLSHDDEVSRRHAALRSTSSGVEVEDLGSANGTFVNDQRIQEPTRLSSGDTVRLGRTNLQVEVEVAEQATVIRETPPATAPAAETLPRPPVEASTGPPPYAPPAAAQAPPLPPAPAYGAPSGGAGIGVGAVIVLLLAVVIGLVWAIPEGLRVMDQSDFLDTWLFTVLIASLALVVVAAIFAVPGGIALLRGRPSGRMLAVLAGIAGIVGPIVFTATVISQGGSPGTLTWVGVVGTGLAYAAGLILGAVAGSRAASRY
jgi:FHA domain